jgi:hypothetical protein
LQIQRSQALLEAVGIDMVNNCMTLPALGTAGGIFMMALERYFSLQLASITKYTISATITMIAVNLSWSMTRAYEPQSDLEKRAFL